MKAIIIYSGKGGVGKTTSTTLLALALGKRGHKVMVIDADVNTPSMHALFPNKGIAFPDAGSVQVISLGYTNPDLVYVAGSQVRSYINACIKTAKETRPDFILIDTPPSVTDLHLNLVKKLKASGIIIVTQPTALSVADVQRTDGFFHTRKVPTIGVVLNMVGSALGSEPVDIGMPVLAEIPLDAQFNDHNIFNADLSIIDGAADQLANLDEAHLHETEKRKFSDEKVTIDTLRGLLADRKNQRFYNIETWDYIADRLQREDPLPGGDHFFQHCTAHRIAEMLSAFEEEDEAMLRVTKSPNTPYKVFPAEVGKCRLILGKKSYYGVPRVEMATPGGPVTLFPYEVMPVNQEALAEDLRNGFTLTPDGRYLPPLETLHQIDDMFGSAIGLGNTPWEQLCKSQHPDLAECQ